MCSFAFFAAAALFAVPVQADQLIATVNLSGTYGEWIPDSTLRFTFDYFTLDSYLFIPVKDTEVGVPHEYSGAFLPFLIDSVPLKVSAISAAGYWWHFTIPMNGSPETCTATCDAALTWHRPFPGAFTSSIWTLDSMSREPTTGNFNVFTTFALTGKLYGAGVPEPSAFVFLVIAALSLPHRRRWR